MSHKPPHLETEEDIRADHAPYNEEKVKFSQQGPSKYGK